MLRLGKGQELNDFFEIGASHSEMISCNPLTSKVSDLLRVPVYKLKLLHRADVLKEGALKDLSKSDQHLSTCIT